MIHTFHPERIAKFGGSSMAAPLQVAYQLEQPGNEAGVVVVSAPGINEQAGMIGQKVTDLLLDYAQSAGQEKLLQIKSKFAMLAGRLAGHGSWGAQAVLDNIESDITEWEASGNAIPALGEYWSARLFASCTGRTFVDARDIIYFDENNNLDEDKTNNAIRERLTPDKTYVVPGFYGNNPEGRVVTFSRGGSDITWAIIAKALEAEEGHNWSDVYGFMTAPPRHTDIQSNRVKHITYQEAHAFASGGSELLHRDAARILGGTGIQAYVRNTFGYHGDMGTRITDTRDWHMQPIVGITAQPVQQYATDESSEHGGAIHIIGEGLAAPSAFVSRTIANLADAMDRNYIRVNEILLTPNASSITIMVNPAQVARAVRIAHSAIVAKQNQVQPGRMPVMI